MSASDDERVASLKFDNTQFEAGVKSTLASLEALNRGLKLEGAAKGLSDLNAAGHKVDLSHIGRAVDDVAGHFHAASIVAITALANIATQAFHVGESVVKSLTVDPINQGLQEYQVNINSIQTILSNTRWQHTGLVDVNKALDELNHYADLTIYNFSEMARNIGTFTAAGVKLDVATNAIKGIANLAAVSGSSSQQASVAMYQLSQAIATGTVKLIDWNSVVNAGMGGKVFQDALIETARAHGVAVDKIIKKNGSFRASLQEGWLTANILTETLSHFTSDLTEQQLLSMGYSKEQAKNIIAMGKDATDAATKVKTLSQLLNTLQEAAGSGWAKTWQLIFGDFDEAKSLFSDVYKVLGGFIDRSADSRNQILSDWKELGGRTVLIEAIGSAWKDLFQILTPIKYAFRDIFPKTTGDQLYRITLAIKEFFDGARLGVETMNNLRRTFAGVFAIFGIGWEIVKQVFRVLFELFGTVQDGQGGILEFTANIGDFLVEMHKAVKEGTFLTKFFDGIAAALKIPIKLIQMLGTFLAGLFDDFDASGAEQAIGKVTAKLTPFQVMTQTIKLLWDRVVNSFDEAWTKFFPLGNKIADFFNDFGNGMSDIMRGAGINDLIAGVNTGLLGYLVISLTHLFGRGGVISDARQILQNVNDTLNTMQNTLRAATLLQIALALGILTISVNQLSKIDGAKLAKALTGLTVMIGQLVGALALIQAMPGGNLAKLYAVTGAMIIFGAGIKVLVSSVKDLGEMDPKALHKGLIAVALLMAATVESARLMPSSAELVSTGLGIIALALAIKIMASAVNDLKDLNWNELAKGLVGVGVILGALTLFTRFAEANATGVLSGTGIILLAVGIKILASAVQDLSGISWENIGKGMATLATALTAIGIALTKMPPHTVISAAGVLLVAVSLGLITDALSEMSQFSWLEIGKGMTVLAGALALIAAALNLIPPSAPITAAGILIVALALESIGAALKVFGGMGWTEIAKGLIVLAGALGIIALALHFMETALPGAFAVLIVANALIVLTGVMKIIAGMSWGEIIKSLVGLALAFAVLGIASAALQPVIPAMFSLGAALIVLGAGLALIGGGIFLLATGLTMLSVAGAAGTAAVVAFVAGVLGLIPLLVKQLLVALGLILKFLIDQTPTIVKFLVNLLIQLLQGIIKMTPVLTVAIIKLLDMLIKILIDAVPKLWRAGLAVLIAVLEGIRDNIGKIVAVSIAIVAEYIRAIGKEQPKLIAAGFRMIIDFLNGLSKAIDENSEEMGRAGARLGIAIIEGMVKGLRGGVSEVTREAKNVAKSALGAAADFLGINSPSKEFEKIGMGTDEGFALGIHKFAHLVEDATEGVGRGAMDSLRSSISGLSAIISDSVDAKPTITPVLDLTQLEKDANKLGSLVNIQPLKIGANLNTAHSIAASARGEDQSSDPTATAQQVIFNQTNVSPKALSTADIYRQTKNQLSVAKEVVTP